MTAASSTTTGSEPPRKLSGIEAGRGIAATGVVLYHVSRHLDKAYGAPFLRSVFQFGHAGVDFFFVISGFIILFVHYGDVNNPIRLSRYVGRRFARLMPIYWVALTLTVALDLAGAHFPSLISLAKSALLLPSNYVMVLGVAWTLQFEILFYTLFCVLIVSRMAGLIILTTWLSVTIWAAATSLNISWLPTQFYGAYNVEFFLGMAIAYVLRNYTIPHAWLVLATGLLLFSMAAVLEDVQLLDGYSSAARFAYGIPAALIVLGIAEVDRHNLLRVPQLLRRLGAASYSIYLFQFVFIGVVWQAFVTIKLNQRIPLAMEFLMLVLAAVVGGVVVSNWVEYPLIRLVRHRFSAVRVRPNLG